MTDDGIVGHGNLGLGLTKEQVTNSYKDGNSQNFLRQICKIYVTFR